MTPPTKTWEVVAAWIAVVVAMLACASRAKATVLSVPFGQEYTSGTVPAGAGPWATALFDDHDTPGSVTLTLSASLLGGGEFVSNVLFNLDPALDPLGLQFSAPVKSGVFGDPVASAGPDAFSAGGGSSFDVRIHFDTGGPANRFGGTDSVTYTISGIPGLTAGSFAFSSAGGGSGALLASAHVQGIGTAAQNSSWVTVPEPASSSLLLLSGCRLLLGRRRR